MLQVFPFLAWIAVVTSGLLLLGLRAMGELGRGSVVLVMWFMIAGYCQFFARSTIATAAGLVLQTILAVYLLIRWKASA